jgi:transcriptional regulator with PAS, ATPase and Fis domain
VTVLILGESGTGKERVASAIHRASPRGRAPFVVVNCAGLSPTQVEAEIFGQPGPFERADGGTVLLDEIGALTSESQIKLLCALQERPFDVRVIAATNMDLARATARGRFRTDLYYRLNVYELRVPPLRRRGAADIQLLVDATIKRFAERKGRLIPVLDPSVLDLFHRYDWPGNVRELENTLERMMVAAGDEPCLRAEHLPERFPSSADRTRPLPSAADVLAALQRNGSSYRHTAAELGLSRHQLYRLLKRHDLHASRPRESTSAPASPTRAGAPHHGSNSGEHSPASHPDVQRRRGG